MLPESPRYGNLEIFDKIENDITDINSKFNNASFAIFGDFSAKIGKLPDYIVFDEFVADRNFDAITVEDMSLSNLLNLGLPFARFSQDSNNVNNYGRRLLELCKSTGVLIANGRCGKGISIGKIHLNI